MRALIQRVSRASVRVGGTESSIGRGFVILLGVKRGDTVRDAAWLARKCAGLRIFEDDRDRMNVSLLEAGGEALVVSQFTLYGDAARGRRPSFTDAALPADAEPLYQEFVAALENEGVRRVVTGVFQAMMTVTIVNEGPVTILVDSRADDFAPGLGRLVYPFPKPLILASASPRRAELLEQAGIPFSAEPTDVEEVIPAGMTPIQAALDLARRKALSAAGRFPGRHILGADTIVDLEGEALNKPAHDDEAVEMLTRLAGRAHEVHTGLALITSHGALRSAVETTRVTFRRLSPEEIAAYVATGESQDKAGAYGIQGHGSLLVERVEGSYDNVIGLPTALLIRMLEEAAS
jgi:MAF protein/D-tyrosyl-tRNA(Tyr) deacylase